MEHLIELRSRLIVSAFAVAIGVFIGWFASKEILALLVHPLDVAQAVIDLHKKKGEAAGPFELLIAMTNPGSLHIQSHAKLISNAVLEVIFTRMKVAVFTGIVLAFPVLAWQLYRFVAPGLYRRERMAFLPFLIAAPILFVMGAAMVYFIMLPFVLGFSLSQQQLTANVTVELLPRIGEYLDLVTKLLLGFGLCFQLPVVLTLAGQAGLISAEALSKGRRYAIVGIVIVAAIVTPPDMISPFLLAVPIYGLYEVSIWCVRLIELRRKREDAAAGVEL
ncbi:MAG: twin-arginine translocase subunit TatC [Proteobacteria bacterium]|nr:twin-arginine translocase subunit TatC [Pseudomonadota bacterium]